MGGDQVIGEELALAGQTVQIIETGFELQQRSSARLAHQCQDMLFGVFRSHFHLSRDMVLHHFAQVSVAMFPVALQHIIADAGGHENFFYARDLADLAQEINLRLVVNFHQRANIRIEATFGGADALGEFPTTFEAVHVGGGAA